MFIGTLIFLSVILVLVAFLLIYAIVRYRERPGAPEPVQIFGSRRLEIVWTAIPIVSLMILSVFTGLTMRPADPPDPPEQPDLRIVGHQWWWEADYLKSGVITANEIHIPAGHQLLVEFRSADVIHDFWVAQLARKIDVIPGHPNHIWLAAGHPGTYLGACAEFCGNEHAWMRFFVIAQPPDQFAAWVRGQLRVPAKPSSVEALRGQQLFIGRTCANCHMVQGTVATQHIGPDLTHFASRATFAAGAAENTPANLALWLYNPNIFKPESHMPVLRLDNQEISELVAYLETLK